MAQHILSWFVELWRNMTPAKWLQLFTYFLACCGLFNFLADKKWNDDRRTHREKQFLRLLRTCWSTIIVGVGVALLFYFSQKERAPNLFPFVNGVPIEKDCYVTIPVTNNAHTLDFWVANTGALSADGLVIDVYFPDGLKVIPSGKWVAPAPSSASTPASSSVAVVVRVEESFGDGIQDKGAEDVQATAHREPQGPVHR